MPPMNILLITSDQQHWTTLGVLNDKIKTPNLDRLAAMGTNFTRGYCPNPTCTPTRASIITGQYPSTHGAFTLGTKLDENVPTIGDHLRKAGYATTLVGKAHFQPLLSTDDCESVECYPMLRDLDFWKTFNDEHTPWYGFDRVELARNHADEGHVGQQYAVWMEENGLPNWRDYFQPRHDGIKDTETDGTLAPPLVDGPGYGWRKDMTWKLPEEFHYTAWTGQRTIAAMRDAHAAGKPFFVWSSYHDPHPPYCVPEPWASMYNPEDMEVGKFVDGEFDHMPPPHQLTRDANGDFGPYNQDGKGNHGYHPHVGVSEQELKEAQAIYYGMISFMDHWIGQTLDALDEMGLTDQTLIVFTSDHGHFVGEHGLVAKGPFHYDDVIRVPFLAAVPGQQKTGNTSADIQTLVDLAPTFLEAAGLGPAREMQGVSQLDSWRGTAEPTRDHAIVENHHNASDAVHLRTLVTDRYKLTVYRGRDWGELFDMQEDPHELHNRYDDPAYAEARSAMMMKLIQADLEREPAPQPRVAGA
ncbi:sulfatase family protein [Algisphaera agarilytica]|uniref:Arylsulfatase A-like enzyme n=1 Tax=Algisphaera agarilytica TaxID=1385975 RepID=A0A7X0LLG7_9BACT|nr:sulfatase-like hydrolase/transferase [Algisphaera agarilytica]MBB6430621.1 arylsulfatase A-like enzyme [Algisphaera agarilytica]